MWLLGGLAGWLMCPFFVLLNGTSQECCDFLVPCTFYLIYHFLLTEVLNSL